MWSPSQTDPVIAKFHWPILIAGGTLTSKSHKAQAPCNEISTYRVMTMVTRCPALCGTGQDRHLKSGFYPVVLKKAGREDYTRAAHSRSSAA